MNILFISPYLPSETSGHAGAQLIYRNIISLAKNHQITLASFIDSGEEYMLEPLINFGIDVHTIYYPRNKKSFGEKLSTGIKNIVPMVTFIAGKEPLYFAKYKNNQMTDLISRLNNENVFDIVQIEYNVMHHYRNLFQEIPSIIVFHDVSTKMYERGQTAGEKSNERSYKLAQKVEAEIAQTRNENILEYTNPGPYPLLEISSALISDYSSVIFDYMPTKKPFSVFAYDIDLYKDNPGY